MKENIENMENFPNIVGIDYIDLLSRILLKSMGKDDNDKESYKKIFTDLIQEINLMLINHCLEEKVDELVSLADKKMETEERLDEIEKLIPEFPELINMYIDMYKKSN